MRQSGAKLRHDALLCVITHTDIHKTQANAIKRSEVINKRVPNPFGASAQHTLTYHSFHSAERTRITSSIGRAHNA